MSLGRNPFPADTDSLTSFAAYPGKDRWAQAGGNWGGQNRRRVTSLCFAFLTNKSLSIGRARWKGASAAASAGQKYPSPHELFSVMRGRNEREEWPSMRSPARSHERTTVLCGQATALPPGLRSFVMKGVTQAGGRISRNHQAVIPPYQERTSMPNSRSSFGSAASLRRQD